MVSNRTEHDVSRVTDAWAVTRGANAVVAVVDAGIDVANHPAFAGRTLPAYPTGEETRVDAPRARVHGTKVAGLILAADPKVCSFAPEARLLPVSVPAISVRVGDPTEADGLRWAADHRADVIVCAWSPGSSFSEHVALPASTRDALDYCLTRGRDGKGCVIVFSAGNTGADVALNGYAAHPGVIAVGACNCHGRRAAYSGWGDALWCVFSSNDPRDSVGAWTTYTTTVPAGSLEQGEAFYTTRFGFTSAACAAVAGICALIVSANPNLTYQEVKAVLRDSCVKIDGAGGTYDGHGHSPLYGFGRPDAARAVELAHNLRLLTA